MAFSASSTDIALSGSVLSASCRDGQGGYSFSSIDLNNVIGNINGRFNWDTNDFFGSAQNVWLEGAVLVADLRTSNEEELVSNRLNLNFCIANIDGTLTFVRPSTKIREGCSLFNLQVNYNEPSAILSALCIANDGLLHASSIDINQYLSNTGGAFNGGEGQSQFVSSATNISLEGLTLGAQLKNYEGNYVWATFDLSGPIANSNGSLCYDSSHDGWYDREGALARYLDQVPLIGYTIAGVNLVQGEEGPFRALAECIYYSIVTGGAALGTSFGGPVGAAIGADFIARLALVMRNGIGNNATNAQMRDQVAARSVWRFTSQTALRFVAPGGDALLATSFGAWLSAAPPEFLENNIGSVVAAADNFFLQAGLNPIDRNFIPAIYAAISNALDGNTLTGENFGAEAESLI